MVNIFKSIIERDIPAEIVWESENILAFKDINPVAATHILIIPKKLIQDVNAVEAEDLKLMGELFLAAKKIAEQEGVSVERLRFLPQVGSEAEHRANLGIADIVLDTYPYNGATTTMETLWMCIPMVTRVGQQFAARNSYTMMTNAGITEGIAWTDDEYVEWGIRLGTDENLRKQIFWKLKESRKIAPLWNAKQFTKDMEDAYQQMWNIYLEQNNDKHNR
jgi:hypothetical protein